MIRFGILSTSSIAPRFIAAVRETNAFDLVAVSSRTREKAEQFGAAHSIPCCYGSHEELLADPQVDAVYISCVNALHYKWARAALEAGKHVICEKPCTTTEAQTRELFALAGEKGLFLMEAQKMLFLPAVLALKEQIKAGRLGKVRMVSMTHSFDGSYNNWMYDEAAGGGPLLSSGIYVMELLPFLFGCPVRSIGGHRTLHPGTSVEEQYVLNGQLENGILFELKNSTVAPLENGAAIYGEQGYALLPDYWKARTVTFVSRDGQRETLSFPCEHELVYEVDHIRDCLDRGLTESPSITGDFSAQAIAALEQVRWE